MVLVERHLPTNAPLSQVQTDHAHGAALTLEHLVSRGIRRVLVWAGDSPTSGPFRAGLLGAAPHWGIEVGEPAIEQESGEFARLCRNEAWPAAVVHNDLAAEKVCKELLDLGVQVGREVLLVSHDDETAHEAPVPLTAVAPPKADLGRESVALAVRLARGEGPDAPMRLSLLPRLVVRESTQGR